MNPAFSIRQATEADIPVIRSLADRIWRACYPGMISEEQIGYMLRWMYSPEKLGDDFARGVRYELLESASGPAAYLATETQGNALYLHKLYLLPELHGRGMGRDLLEHVFDLARQSHLSLVRLNVNKANARALASYQRAGFIVERSVVNDIGGGFVMDDYVMSRSV